MMIPIAEDELREKLQTLGHSTDKITDILLKAKKRGANATYIWRVNKPDVILQYEESNDTWWYQE